MTDDPKSRYKMLWAGQWRPVTWMGDRENNETTNRINATRAVLYISDDEWVPTLVAPGDIVRNEDAPAADRQWETIN